MGQHYEDLSKATDKWTLPNIWATEFGPYTDKPADEGPEYIALAIEAALTGTSDEDRARIVNAGFTAARELHNEALAAWSSDARECPCNHGDEGEAGLEDHGTACAGWYACFCVPGCMPDSDWSGPFATEDEAVNHLRSMYGE